MGDPKLPRKNWRKPKRPLNYDLKVEELKTLGDFGLRTKRELWKTHTELSRLRKQARAPPSAEAGGEAGTGADTAQLACAHRPHTGRVNAG